MAIINPVNEVLHRIRVNLYPNYLPKAEGVYIARTDNETSLSIEEVCAAFKNRGGFTGNYGDLVEYVKQLDISSEAVNETITPGGQFSIARHKIKVAREEPEVGVCFVSAEDPAQRVKVSGHLVENAPSQVIGVIPALAARTWKVESLSQYTTGSAFLKEPRAISFAENWKSSNVLSSIPVRN
ncbi:MAG: DUF4469 domain-containing protein [Treponema sp.]|nr:DUF4469 domain-containing protein [Treponema sp.]